MTRRIYLFISLAAAAFMMICSCAGTRSRGNCSYHLVLEVADPASIDAVKKVILHRLDHYGIMEDEMKFTLEGNKIDLVINNCSQNEDRDRIKRLCVSGGNLGLWETYDNLDVFPYFNKIDNALKPADAFTADSSDEDTALNDRNSTGRKSQLDSFKYMNPIFSRFRPATYESGRGMALAPGAMIGHALVKDTADLMSLLDDKRAKNILPRDIRFMWGKQGTEQDGSMLMLYAVKAGRDGKAQLSGDITTQTEVHFSNGKEPSITITMNPEAARIWARMTGYNIGKSIAIVLDDKVYSCPVVQSQITGGVSEITGRFTEAEAKELANILQNGSMPSPVKIVAEDFNCKK